MSVVELFYEQVDKYSEEIAVFDEKLSLTYEQLDKRSNQVANWLECRGVKQGNVVLLILDPGIDIIIWIIAIAKVGGIYITLDINAPSFRVNIIINDAAPKLVITTAESLQIKHNALEFTSAAVWSSISNYSIRYNTIIHKNNSSLAIFYTSGSTGTPRGVTIGSDAVVNLAQSLQICNYDIKIFAQFNNIAFDPSILEIWGSLLNGMSLFIIPLAVKQNIQDLQRTICKYGIQGIVFPTAYFHQLLSTYPQVIDNVRVVHFGGEQVNGELLLKFLQYRREHCIPIRLINNYGPTEATVVTTRYVIDSALQYSKDDLMSIGWPIPNVDVYVLNESMQELQVGVAGELYVSGINVSLGYHNLPNINREKFIKHHFKRKKITTYLYKTGDIVKQLPDERLLYIGRVDDQVKISGFRVHLSEVEGYLAQHEDISLAKVLVSVRREHKFLVAYIILRPERLTIDIDAIKRFLSYYIPYYMIPNTYIMIDKMPLTAVGKIDVKQLEQMFEQTNVPDVKNDTLIEEALITIWQQLLNINSINPDKNLFELGANSLKLAEACVLINKTLQSSILISDIIANASIYKLANFLRNNSYNINAPIKKHPRLEIAVVGFACRFPQSSTWQEYWEHLCRGNNCLTNFANKGKYLDKHIDSYKTFVPIKGVINGIDEFDAEFFGFSPADASTLDPQHRIFLECIWEALELSGNVPYINNRVISVFAGQADSTYLQTNLLKSKKFSSENDWFNARLSTSMGALSTRASYKLNLRGKSINVNTACSTGLIAIEQACQDLFNGYSDIALAGAVAIDVGQRDGYYYQEHGIESSNGLCCPFSNTASGTIFSDGAGVVVLKRLSQAIQDNDTIYSVIRGCGVNNDGSDKLGYTAPSINGQIECIMAAIDQAQISAEQIGFVETHGTATAIGDVIEFTALNKAHKHYTDHKNYCALGSVKANIGHTDIAAGIAGFIKASLCLFYKTIPPMLHFSSPNADIDLDDSPFYINDNLLDWAADNHSRYAGVSAFGIGGTNAHVILEEYINAESTTSKLNNQLLIFSAKTQDALERYTNKIIPFLNTTKINTLADIAYTLCMKREYFLYRAIAIGKDGREIIEYLRNQQHIANRVTDNNSIVFMFAGQGTQYSQMAIDLMQILPYFASIMNTCNSIARQYMEVDCLSILQNSHNNMINQTQYTQIILFIIEYSIAQLLIQFNVIPQAVIGHSVGEYVAACIAGVFSLEDSIKLVCVRGQLMSTIKNGAMLSIECSLEDFQRLVLDIDIDLALHNSTYNCVAAGSVANINKLIKIAQSNNYQCHLLQVSHAFHSRYMNKILDKFEKVFTGIAIYQPQIPLVSNVTGEWISSEEITNSQYWSKQLLQTVHFKLGVETLLSAQYNCFIEIGPGFTLSAFTKEIARNYNSKHQHLVVLNTLPNHRKLFSDEYTFLSTLGALWQSGVVINWSALYATETRRQVCIPAYSFARQKYWVEADLTTSINKDDNSSCYIPHWVRYSNLSDYDTYKANQVDNYTWIFFKGNSTYNDQLIDIIKLYTNNLFIVEYGHEYCRSDNKFIIELQNKSHYTNLFKSIKNQISGMVMITHLFSCDNISQSSCIENDELNIYINKSFYSILYMSQAYVEELGASSSFKCMVITRHVWRVYGEEIINPINSMLLGICNTIPQEQHGLLFKLIDIGTSIADNSKYLLGAVVKHCLMDNWDAITPNIAVRCDFFWKKRYTMVQLNNSINRLKDHGVYFFTGGLGGIALTICEIIATAVRNPIFILVSRTQFPDRSQWSSILDDMSQIDLHKKIILLQKIELLGGKVFIKAADVTVMKSLKRIVDCAIKDYGVISGVIHAAGIAGQGVMLFKTPEEIEAIISAKILGTHNLAHVLSKNKLDFVMLCSSISSLIGVTGLGDYGSANAYLDAVAESNILFNSKFVVSINWNTWQDIGMAASAKSNRVDFIDAHNSITPSLGQNLFLKIISDYYSQVVISTIPIEQYAIIVNKEQITSASTINTEMPIQALSVTTDPIKSTIIKQWQDILGITYISHTDDFFALGGHSLKALKLIERLSKELRCKITLQQLYACRTVEKLAALIASLRGCDNNHLNDILVSLSLRDNTVDDITINNIFFFHPVGGTLFCFDTIISNFVLPFNIYGLQDPSIASEHFIFSNILEMAQVYADKIIHMQPNGPYYLIGYSFGGTVAYEVANILLGRSKRINFLGLIDSWAKFSSDQFNEVKFYSIMKHYNKEISDSVLDLAWYRMKMLLSHTPSNMNHNMVIFKANILLEEFKIVDEETNYWGMYNSGNIKIHNLAANHETIVYGDSGLSISITLAEELNNKL